MRENELLQRAFAMPLTNPAYRPAPIASLTANT
jgi:acetoacetate decarboxylase